MARNNGSKEEILRNPYPESASDGNHNQDWWNRQYDGLNSQDRFKQVLTIPESNDMGGVLARSVIRNERQLKAVISLLARHVKFGDRVNQEKLRCFLAGTIGGGGRGRLDGIFATTNLLASDMLRAVMGMPKLKKGEEERITRGSDFRSQDKANSNMDGSIK